MAERRTILVVGATGAQGGSVARHLLERGEVAVRCLTRNPDSQKAHALQRAGAEVVKGDLEDPARLRAALDGCDAAFGVTNFWEHFEREYPLGKNLIDAVSASGIAHFVFSSLPPAKKISNGELEVPHFDIKARLEEYARSLGLPATFVHMAFYFENFFASPPQRRDDGSFLFGFPQGDTPLAGVAVEDVGGVVSALFERPRDYIGRTVGIVGDDRPPREYAEIMTRVLGRTVVYSHVPREVYASLGFPGAEELANMFEFYRRFVPSRRADLEESRALHPQIRQFEPWLIANREKFLRVLGQEAAGAR